MTNLPKALLEHEDRAFILYGYKNPSKADRNSQSSSVDANSRFVLLTPEKVSGEKVRNAWTYAVRHTAKALDEPDYVAALAMIVERHPNWMLIESILPSIGVDLVNAGDDIPDNP